MIASDQTLDGFEQRLWQARARCFVLATEHQNGQWMAWLHQEKHLHLRGKSRVL